MQILVERNALGGMSMLLTFVLVGALLWMVTSTIGRVTENAEQIRIASDIVEVIAELKERLVEVETGERGYIITGVDVYLEPHEQGLAAVSKLHDRLAGLMGVNSPEHKNIAELDRHIDSKIEVSHANVQERKLGFDRARARVIEGSGKREMDRLRMMLDDLIDRHNAAREELRQQRHEMLGDLRSNMAVTAVVFFAVLVYLHWRLMRMAKLQSVAVQQMQHLASHDTLTGLPNRRLMMELLSQSIQRCKRHKKSMVLLFLDLNGFKLVNDRFGHEAGDEVLRQVGQRLSGLVRASDKVARLGGDEFVILAEDVAGEQDVETLVRKINNEVERPIRLSSGVESNISTSIGMAIYPQDGEDMEALLHNADAAMYEAKRKRDREQE